MRHLAHKLRKHENGRIAVDQGTEGMYEISYNPDDERFYVHLGEDTVAIRAELRNAVQYARTRK